jgi:hypothetical protein
MLLDPILLATSILIYPILFAANLSIDLYSLYIIGEK